jgi:DNA repair exonuclease SbcCD ATPase subunit
MQSVVDSEIKKLPDETRKFVEKVLMNEIKTAINAVDEKLNWKLLSLEFSNMFSYGPNNIIDFTKLTFDEITGLFGPNSIGKSSLIDILLFSLFDDYSRNYQDKHKCQNSTIINTKEKEFSCKVSFSVDNTIYFIEKEGRRVAPKTEYTTGTFKPTKYDFYKMDSNNKVQLNGQDQIQTLKEIKKIIGDYNDFCISSVCLQHNLRDKIDFFNMSPSEKKKFLNDRLHFDIFKNIEDKYKDLLKENKINIKHIEKTDEYANYDYNIDSQIKHTSDSIETYELSKIDLNKHLKNNNNELSSLYEKLKYVDDDIDCLLSDKKEISNKIDIIQNKLKKYSNINFDEKIEELYNTNQLLSSKLSSSNCDYNLEELFKQQNELTVSISNIKIKINKLHLIKNKLTIILNNEKFEKQKVEKIIELKTNILPESKIISKNKFQKKIVENLRDIFALSYVPNFNEQLNKTNINILNLENNINYTNACIKNIQNILSKYIVKTIDESIIQKYNTINYDEYFINMTNVLNDYDKYYDINKVIESNNDIFILLNDFNKCINKSCSNCLLHSQNINNLFTKLNIYEECTTIKNKFNELEKIKNEFEQIVVHHNKNKLNNYQSVLQIYGSMLEYEKDTLNKLLDKTNDTNYIEFINNIKETLVNIEQNNLLHELNDITNETNEEFILLNTQIKQYNDLSNELKLCESNLIDINKHIVNYDKDNNLLKQIETNKVIIQELKLEKNNVKTFNSELSKLNNTLVNINNSEYNSELYQQINKVKKNMQTITNNIILVNNEINQNKQLLQKLNYNKNNYIKLSNELIKYNKLSDMYENIIKITGPKGIPRQIINIKLQHVEDNVNNIIFPFIKKKIIITKDIDDIKVLIDDGSRKYYNCGGMENFIIAMAFKIAFTHTFNIPQTGILFIDEGVSVLDKEHIRHFDIISNFIKQYYNHIILVTHIDSFYDYTFDVMNITQNTHNQSIVRFCSNTDKITKEDTLEINKPIIKKMKQPTKTNKKKPLEIIV